MLIGLFIERFQICVINNVNAYQVVGKNSVIDQCFDNPPTFHHFIVQNIQQSLFEYSVYSHDQY